MPSFSLHRSLKGLSDRRSCRYNALHGPRSAHCHLEGMLRCLGILPAVRGFSYSSANAMAGNLHTLCPRRMPWGALASKPQLVGGWIHLSHRRPRFGSMALRVEAGTGKKLGQQTVVDLTAVSTTLQSASQTFVRRFGSLLDFATDVVAIGGHRGMGANKWSVAGNHGRGRYRENTLKSFHKAVRSGATFVEFDVQTTADGVPVIWHDNYIVFGDPSCPTSKLIRELTYAEFCQLAPINDYSGAAYLQTPNDNTAVSISSNSSDSTKETSVDGKPASSLLSSSGSSGRPSSTASLQSSARRARLLRQLQNGYPARPGDASLDAWYVDEEDHFPTLQQVFTELPEDVAFDIEIKMTTPDTEPCTPPEEVARQLDAILAVVDGGLAAAPRRRLLFSSFCPEVCAELKRRRPEFAVMFLSGGGAYPHVDPRRTSVTAAVDFAASAGLQGIILESAALRVQPHMIEVARGRGLQVLTYGLANDDPEWVRKQFFLGVHGVIVDDVAGVSAALSAALT